MKIARMVAALVSTGLALTANLGLAQIQHRPIEPQSPYPPAFAAPQTALEIPFDLPKPDYFVLPGDANFGEISAVATNSKGHVFILSRSNAKGDLHGGSATQVFEFDEKGKYVRELGRDLYSFGFGHGIRVDKNDDIWVVDKGTDMVTKISNKTGKVLLVLGRREELSTHYWNEPAPDPNAPASEGWFREPTDVAWDSQGNIYVSDGYVNSRVAKFDKEGNWVGSWGKRGNGPGEFWIAHNVVVDKYDHVWVADRSNGRLQVFDTEGNFLREVIINVATPPRQPLQGHQYPPGMDALKDGTMVNLAYRPGAPDAVCIPPTNPNVMFVGDLYPGRIYKIDLTGKVLGYFSSVGKSWGQTGGTHGIACPTENLLYSADFINWRTQRWVLHPERAQTAVKQTDPQKTPDARIADAKPGEVRALVTFAFHGPFESVLPQAAKVIGHPIVAQYGSARGNLKTLALSRQDFEIAILLPDVNAELLGQNKVRPGTWEIARAEIGFGIRGDASSLDLSTPAAIKAAMVGAKSVKYAPTGAALMTVRKILGALDIADRIKDSSALSSPVPLGPGEYEINIYPLSEIVANKALQNRGAVIAPFQVPAVIEATIGKNANDPAAALALIKYLQGPAIDSYLKESALIKSTQTVPGQ